jgi:hypothetical protein
MFIVGTNKAGENLVQFAHDLVNRLDIVAFESNPDEATEFKGVTHTSDSPPFFSRCQFRSNR